MKLALLIRIAALIVGLFTLTSVGIKTYSIQQQTWQEEHYQAWASDEAILSRTLAEFEAMRKLVSLYATSRDPIYINHYLDLVGLHNGTRVYSEPVGNDYWIDVITGQRKTSLIVWGIGDNLNERLYSLRFVQPEEPAVERILDLKHQLEKSELNAFAKGMSRYVNKPVDKYLPAPIVQDTFGVLFDRKHIELTHALTFEVSSLLAREKRRYLRLIDNSRSALEYSVMADVMLTLGFLSLLFIGLLAINRKVIDPINSLYSASEEIMKGDYAVRVNNRNGTHEIMLLTRAFNRMIRSFQRDLEKSERVKKALEDVHTANLEKERAKNESRIKTSFLANMSHEIRTPMNAILGMTALTLKTDLHEKQRDYLKKIQLSSNNLLHLINSILDLSKLESDMFKLEKKAFRFDDVLEEVFGTLGSEASSKKIRLLYNIQTRNTQGVLDHLVGDSLRIGQILKNLMGNAIKFTQRGFVSLGVKLLEQYEHEVILKFTVRDSGIGMSSDKLQTVFEKFTQADSSTTRMYGGSGLGLSIAKELVLLMDGDINAQSVYGKGSTFNFTLKLQTTLEQRMDTNRAIASPVFLCTQDTRLQKSISSLLNQHDLALNTVSAQQLVWMDAAVPKHAIVLVDCDMGKQEPQQFLEVVETVHLNGLKYAWISNEDSIEVIRNYPTLSDQRILTTPVLPTHLQLLDAPHDHPPYPGADIAFQAAVASPTRHHGHHTATLLIVEDHPLNMELLLDFLAPLKYHTTCAKDGHEAIDILTQKQSPFNLIITDLEMPTVDGYQLAQWVRGNATHNNTAIVALTAHAFEQTRARCQKNGINDIVTKPFHEEELFRVIRMKLEEQKDVLTGFEQHPQNLCDDSDELLAGDVFMTHRFSQARLAKYLQKLLETNGTLLEKLEQLQNSRQLDAFRREIHSLVGVLGMLCTEDIKSHFHFLEQSLLEEADMVRVLERTQQLWPVILNKAEQNLQNIHRIGQI